MKKFILIVVMFLTGCSSGEIFDSDLKKAYKLCEANGGLNYIYFYGASSEIVCKNEAHFAINIGRFNRETK